MRMLINSVSMRGVVVIGEGEKDHAPMLYNGEEVGDGTGAACDVAVDPIDGTRLCANGMPNAISVLAVAGRGSMYDPSAVFYMSKLAAGPEAAQAWSTSTPRPPANVLAVAKGKALLAAGRHRGHPRPPPPRRADRRGPGHRRPHPPDHRRRRGRRHHGRAARAPAST